MRDGSGRFIAKRVTMSEKLAFLTGLVLGDGFIQVKKTHNYIIGLHSTKEELVELFEETVRDLGFNPTRCIDNHIRKFPCGKVYDSPSIRSEFCSKCIYEIIRSNKEKDSRWHIPNWAKDKLLTAFLKGMYDAEGSVSISGLGKQIRLDSKRIENLEEVKRVLQELGILARIYPVTATVYRLVIMRKVSRRLFKEKVGFQLASKKVKLTLIV